jgi:hypothetical protein
MADLMRHRATMEPVFAEEITSINESNPFLIWPETATPPIRCECCGRWVTMIDEAEADQKPCARKPAIWEAHRGMPFRKHTLRRCNWWSGKGQAAPAVVTRPWKAPN